MNGLYTPSEYDDIPSGIRVLQVVVRRGRGHKSTVLYCTSREALDQVGKRYGSYDATVVREGRVPWDSATQGII